MKIRVKDVKYNCRYFRGDIPCTPHNQYGVYCVDEQRKDCPYYYPTDNRILIIKLGAIGDVIRTSPLLRKLKEVDPHAEIWWLTLTPEVPSKSIDVIIPFTPQSLVTLHADDFDVIYNLDKDKEACALCSLLSAQVKS